MAYESAGTVEFIYDPAREEFYFLEVNTRLQVEHPVTEEVFGIDLVEWMIRQAAGEDPLAGVHAAAPRRAMRSRCALYAEIPQADFRPATGLLTEVAFPHDARVDGWIETGTEVTPYYDPMLAKLIVHAPDARRGPRSAAAPRLPHTRSAGIETNLDYLRAVAAPTLLASGEVSTTALRDLPFAPRRRSTCSRPARSRACRICPGRLGLWHVGVPPSGPMDARSFRLANRLVGQRRRRAALEMTVAGPTLRFHAAP